MNAGELLDLVRHMAWADTSVWSATLTSPHAADDARIRATFHHVHLVQHLFARAWRAEPFEVRTEFATAGDLARWGQDAHLLIEGFVAGDARPPLDADFREPWSDRFEAMLGRTAGSHTLGESVLQTVMHTMHHRGQLCTRLRKLEVEPPTIDWIVWLWAGRPAAQRAAFENRDAAI